MASLSTWLRAFGFDPQRCLKALRGFGRYWEARRRFRAGMVDDFVWGPEFAILDEWDETSGGLGAYFHQDQWVAHLIHEASPRRHVDVGSRLDGFIGNLAIFRQVDVIDIRPQPTFVRNVTFHQLDLMAELPPDWVGCTDSLSCLHTIEHFGLGRYGDPIDANGHLKGLAQLKRMVAPGGRLYLSTPIGPQRVEFNAHRVFAVSMIVGWFAEGWEIERFDVIDDDNRFHESVAWQGSESENHFGCRLGVGIVVARRGISL